MSLGEIKESDRTVGSSDRTVIELCGTLRAEIAGRSVSSLLPGRQGRALFAFLVVNRHRPVGRDELLDVLWPADPPEAPDAGLSTILARVRRAVGDGVIEGRSQLSLHLDPSACIDIERAAERYGDAERALAIGEFPAAAEAAGEALQTVRRPLMPGLEGAWVETRRAELGELEPGLLEVLGRAALGIGDREQLATAERTARELTERHPFRESGHALLMEVQARRGNVAEAMRTFERLRAFLREELGAVPSATLAALHEDLLRRGRLRDRVPGDGMPPAPARRNGASVPLPAIGGGAALTPFVGRSEQLGRLRAPWIDAATGHRCFVLLAGEPGVGKTRLAAEFASEVHRAGGTVLYGRCDEEPLLAYQPFVEALGHFLRFGEWDADGDLELDLQQLRRLMPEARPDADAGADVATKDPGSARYLLFEAVGRLLGRATRRRPVLLVLDDLHWADKPTLLLLRHLLRLTDPARLLVLGIFRDVEVDRDDPLAEFVADMRRESRFDRVALAGLDERETDALVAAHLKTPASDAFIRALHTQTDGNPFFMEESLRSLVEARGVEFGEEATAEALASMGVPDGVSDVILRRLGRVDEVTRNALTAAALIGREFDLNVVRELLAIPAEAVIDAMEEAMVAGLVVEVPDAVDRFSFCHALVRDAIYDRLSASRRCRSHLRVAEVLEGAARASDIGPEELAHHFFLARRVGGAARAVRYAIQAGEKAARALAYEEAAAHYRRALEAFADDPDGDEARRCDVLLALGRVQWQAGDAAARETYFDAAASARTRGAAEQLAGAALGLGERYWEAGAVDEQYQQLLTEALHTLSCADSRRRARLMARMAENLHFTKEQQHGAELSRAAVAMARRLGDVDTLVTALMGRHVALLHVRYLDERLRLIDEVLRLVQGHRALTAEAHHWRLFDLCELGDVTEAHRDHAELSRLATELRQPLLEHLALGWRGTFAHLAGDVEEAERLAGESFKFASRAQVGHGSSSLASMLFTVRRQQGRIGELLPAMRSLADGGSANGAWRAALALAEVETGHLEDGRARYEAIAGKDFSGIPRDWYWALTAALMSETCAALDDVERAPRLYALLEPFAERFLQVIFTTCWGSIQRYLGLLATVMRRFDDAERHFEAALAGNVRMGAVLMTAETECAYSAMLLRRAGAGDRERAAALGARAEATAAARELAGLRGRARGLVEASGI